MKNAEALKWLDKPGVQISGEILFSKISGSKSYNLNTKDSDDDYLSVYVGYNCDLLGLNPPPETYTGHDPDYTCHEIGKFAKLLLKGNPGIVETLFSTNFCWALPAWQDLVNNRKKFLTKECIKHYLGYAQGQLHKLHSGTYLGTTGGDFNSKWAYHMIRLVHDARKIAMGEEPEIWKTGEERDMIMSIRNNEWTKERVTNYTLSQINTIDSMKPWPVPDKADNIWLNDWLLTCRGL